MTKLLAAALVLSLAATSHAVAAPPEYGPVLNPGSPDAAVIVNGRVVQIEYLQCLADPDARWWEDGSSDCLAN